MGTRIQWERTQWKDIKHLCALKVWRACKSHVNYYHFAKVLSNEITPQPKNMCKNCLNQTFLFNVKQSFFQSFVFFWFQVNMKFHSPPQSTTSRLLPWTGIMLTGQKHHCVQLNKMVRPGDLESAIPIIDKLLFLRHSVLSNYMYFDFLSLFCVW